MKDEGGRAMGLPNSDDPMGEKVYHTSTFKIQEIV